MTPQPAASGSTTNSSKPKSMLIAYDGSKEAKRAIGYAGDLLSTPTAYILTAWEPMHGETTPATVTIDSEQLADHGGDSAGNSSGSHPTEAEISDPAHARALSICKEGVGLARDHGFEAQPFLVESQTTIWSAIIDAAEELDADLIVSGTRGASGFKALLQSSVSENVLKHSGRPVLIVPPEH